jgi:hypothetical protein
MNLQNNIILAPVEDEVEEELTFNFKRLKSFFVVGVTRHDMQQMASNSILYKQCQSACLTPPGNVPPY